MRERTLPTPESEAPHEVLHEMECAMNHALFVRRARCWADNNVWYASPLFWGSVRVVAGSAEALRSEMTGVCKSNDLLARRRAIPWC